VKAAAKARALHAQREKKMATWIEGLRSRIKVQVLPNPATSKTASSSGASVGSNATQPPGTPR
jgi:hypothetical protein